MTDHKFSYTPVGGFIIIFLFSFFGITLNVFSQSWNTSQFEGFTLHTTSSDKVIESEMPAILEKSFSEVTRFFQQPFKQPFEVWVYPHRSDLDSAWSAEWGVPGFKSECWMVASGVDRKLDVLSPLSWAQEACEHIFADSLATQRLLNHEMVHVFHGQYNLSPDFSDIIGLDWFVEGLATYASGQCDAKRMSEVRDLVVKGETPSSLDNFWKGKYKYGLSGSIVMYMDSRFGREKLISLLSYNRLESLLSILNITEKELLDGWKVYMTE